MTIMQTTATKDYLHYNAYTLFVVGIDAITSRISSVMNKALNSFLAEHERKAFRMAQLAVGSADDAHDIVQDAMIKLVNKYAHRPNEDWAPLFHRIIQHQITSWHRKQQLQKRWFPWFNKSDETEQDNSPLRKCMILQVVPPTNY